MSIERWRGEASVLPPLAGFRELDSLLKGPTGPRSASPGLAARPPTRGGPATRHGGAGGVHRSRWPGAPVGPARPPRRNHSPEGMDMMRLQALRPLALGAALSALMVSTAPAQQPQQGAITGRITDRSTGQPVPAAQVNVVGTNLGTQTNSEGVYTLRGLTPGTVTLRVLVIGYAEQSQTVTVVAGETVTADFQLQPTAIDLAPVVVTATGEQRRIEVGNSI